MLSLRSTPSSGTEKPSFFPAQHKSIQNTSGISWQRGASASSGATGEENVSYCVHTSTKIFSKRVKTNLFRWTLIITQHPAFLQCNTPAVADPGEGPGGTGAPAPHLFLDQTNRPKKSLMETPPPLSKGLDDRPLPSPPPLISSSRSGTGQ